MASKNESPGVINDSTTCFFHRDNGTITFVIDGAFFRKDKEEFQRALVSLDRRDVEYLQAALAISLEGVESQKRPGCYQVGIAFKDVGELVLDVKSMKNLRAAALRALEWEGFQQEAA